MVWGVCRRVLRNYHDAEDAFQATFLVLVRKAASIASRELLANWLYGVAQQTAMKARANALKRQGRERQVTEMPEPEAVQPGLWHDLQPLLDQELSRLPDKYRILIVLCDLQAKTRKEAAQQLGCPEGTVAGRLARARVMLAKRLAQHGLAVSGGSLAGLLSQSVASAGVPASVVCSTIRAVTVFAAGPAAASGVVSAEVVALTEGVLKTMFLTKLKTVAVVVFAFVLLCGGASVFALRAQEAKNDQKALKADDDKLKETLLDLDKQMWDASTKGDEKAMAKLMAENYVSIWAIDGRTDRAASLESVKRTKYSDRAMRDVEVVQAGKDSAVLTYICSYKVSIDNEEARQLQDRRVSTVWAKRDGRWEVVFTQMISPGGE
jgi:RNA polymerase sigma factor (sigma-70 family)